ncbi:glycyl-tRNA synthetase/ beta subunit [Synechococcus sp. RS9909]|uniref:glycine--tRNA ligase subunit beta n=1 Tax=unclassified Synechococcus TaxID=2626047 RepID=UPI000068F853|nr:MULTISPECIES: glycine--tRNA ligase subunit beta [unclassified Synechococcus]EAQ69145.1 putative Glycyl-tRNA synthetase, beta subunit [Synechococcus sp. RS9917]QNI79599.1 glycyl-tRNA synthetase/ beta subunit [Synechococcus sp. RS9909]
MASTFLLEIGTEELPADFARLALPQLKATVTGDLKEWRLNHGAIQVTSTPRRLAVIVENLVERQEDLREDRKGPPVAQAYVDGQPGPAALGFARRCGVDPSALEVRATPKGDCVFATVLVEGQSTLSLLQERIPGWVDALQGRRFMRWGSGDQRFSRPVRWLVALFGEVCVPVTLAASDPVVHSGRSSRAHRLFDRTVDLADAEAYGAALAAAGVVVDRNKRAEIIRTALKERAEVLQGVADCPPALFEELVDLVEAPRVLTGSIADRYLALPPEVIITVMQSHQRYVPLRRPGVCMDPLGLSAREVLCPDFLLVSNGLASADDRIREGNQRVLSARLADAEFFLSVDRRQPSSARREALQAVTFAEGLGSLRDRSDRIEHLAGQLLERLECPQATQEAARRAAHLCKHDLVSQMVGEFPELQGLIGGKYLLEEGESRAVALAVVEHYQPRGAGDALPSSDAGAVVALAERLELLLSIFAKGERPSGSSDPYALRRAGNGILQILWERGWRLDLLELLKGAAGRWQELLPAFAVDTDVLVRDLVLLLRQRIHSQLEDDGHAPDLVQAVAGDAVSDERLLCDPIDVLDRIRLLSQLRQQNRLVAVQAVVQRAARLAEKGDLARGVLDAADTVDPKRFASPSEQAMYGVVQRLKPLAQARNYQALAHALVEATPTLEAFFDGDQSVMVMADDPELRRNRLNLLSVLRNQAGVLAQFERIQA